MTAVTTPSAADVLVELHQRGIEITIRGEQFGLRPKGKAPDWLKAVMRQVRAELTALLADPRRRWQEQVRVLLSTVDNPAVCEDLIHLFEEREAIASVDGGQDDHHAGQLAYETLIAHLKETC